MKKRAYRRTRINEFSTNAVTDGRQPGRLLLAIDVAKRDMVAAVTTDGGDVIKTVAWTHPAETPVLLQKLAELRASGFPLLAVMEPTATYGDVLRRQLRELGIVVYLATGKRVFDARALHDGVASLHDAKSAAIIAKLHVEGLTTPWQERTDDERALKAAIATMDMYQFQYLRLVHQLEAVLARHWPEICDVVALTSATLMAVLARIGGPPDIAAAPDAVRKLMTGMSHRLMKAEKIERIIASAGTTVGIPLLPGERAALMTLAEEAGSRRIRSCRLGTRPRSRETAAARPGPSSL